MKRKHVIMCIVAAMASAMLFGCGSSKNVSYTDGTYTGQSQVHEGESTDDDSSGSAGDGYGVVEITITDGKSQRQTCILLQFLYSSVYFVLCFRLQSVHITYNSQSHVMLFQIIQFSMYGLHK